MPSEPSWWYDERPRFVTSLLKPVAAIYGQLAARRMWGETYPYTTRLPVICVGNFTAGGTGKTPLTRYLATRLATAGARPAILSRGYGGNVRGPHWVDRGRDIARAVGDEPLLLAADAPVLIARDRVAGARAIQTDVRGFTHIVMDDGLQNPALRKALVIAVVDGVRGVGNGKVMPAGPLRAPLAAQLPLAKVIVVNGRQRDADGTWLLPRGMALDAFDGPILATAVEPDAGAIVSLRGVPLLAFAGIGVPAKYFDMLRGLALDVRETRSFPDHHPYGVADADALLARARAQNLRLVTTEKDLMRLGTPLRPSSDSQGVDDPVTTLARESHVVPIRLTLSDGDTACLDRLIEQASAEWREVYGSARDE